MVERACVSFGIPLKQTRKFDELFSQLAGPRRLATGEVYKTTLWQGEHAMVGLNCLEPGQIQKVHAHQGADKFYFVLQGRGNFTVGDEEREAGAGTLVVAPSGIPHGVINIAGERLSLLVTIAPPFK